jgi:hypothetical protein
MHLARLDTNHTQSVHAFGSEDCLRHRCGDEGTLPGPESGHCLRQMFAVAAQSTSSLFSSLMCHMTTDFQKFGSSGI